MNNITILNKAFKVQEETIFATQNEIATMFDAERSVISKHIKNIFDTGELEAISVCAKIAHTGKDSKVYQVQHYSLDMIIAVGYRVNSIKATKFRVEATKILKEYLTAGEVRKKRNNNIFDLSSIKPLKLNFNNNVIYLIRIPKTDNTATNDNYNNLENPTNCNTPTTNTFLFNINSICYNIGIDPKAQRDRAKKDKFLFDKMYKARARFNQVSLYLPLEDLNYFLNGITIARNSSFNIKQNYIVYQEECYNFINNELSKMNLLLNNSTNYLLDSNTKNNNNAKNIIVLDKRKQIIEYLAPFISSQEINCIISKYKNDDYILANMRSLFSHYNNSKIDIYIIKSVLDNDLACYWSS